MKRVMISSCGSYTSIGFAQCLKQSKENFFLVGTEASERNVFFAQTDEKYVVPHSSESNYITVLNKLIEQHKIDFLYVQSDSEITAVAKFNEFDEGIHTKTFLPKSKTIEICGDKLVSNTVWKRKGIATAKSFLIEQESDLKEAFSKIGNTIWLRAVKGAGGKGCFLAEKFDDAKFWIDFNKGWGNFMAAEYLPGRNIGCDMLFKDGQLICSQAKERIEYVLAKANPTGITGTTGVLKTLDDKNINHFSEEAVFAVDDEPNGLFAVDLKENEKGEFFVTEINAGRFLSSSVHLFYATKFLFPYYFVKIGLNEKVPKLKKYNPLSANIVCLRQVDVPPVVVEEKQLINLRKEVKEKGFARLED